MLVMAFNILKILPPPGYSLLSLQVVETVVLGCPNLGELQKCGIGHFKRLYSAQLKTLKNLWVASRRTPCNKYKYGTVFFTSSITFHGHFLKVMNYDTSISPMPVASTPTWSSSKIARRRSARRRRQKCSWPPRQFKLTGFLWFEPQRFMFQCLIHLDLNSK